MKKLIALFIALSFTALIQSNSEAAYKFFCGKDWQDIDAKSYPASVKTEMKALLLKSANDATMFTGSPIVAKNDANFQEFVPFVDSVYAAKEYTDIPLQFALRIAVMKAQGVPDAQVRVFAASLLKKLTPVQ